MTEPAENIEAQPLAMPVQAVARRLGVSESHIWKLIRLRQLKVVRLARRTLVPAAELNRILAEAV